MEKTKIIFMGTPDFSRVVLQGLLDSGSYEILRVVTQPDRLVGRKRILHQTPVKELAVLSGLTVLQPEKLSGSAELTELIELASQEKVGIVTAAFGQFLPGKLLDAMTFSVNVHASLLPKYRGGAPIHYAVMQGDKEAGVTIMEMVRKMDAGDMIAQRAIPILDDDTVGTMFDKLALVGRDLLLESLPKYLSHELKPVVQNEAEVTFAPNISADEERIDWAKSAQDIFNQIRGMNPFPVAHTLWKGERLKIYDSELAQNLIDLDNVKPGEIIEKTKKTLIVATGQGALSLKNLQSAGKSKMDIASFLNGAGRELKFGDVLGK